MSDGGGTWDVGYYETESGRSPVFEWLQDMSEDQALALGYIGQLARPGMETQRPPVRQSEGKLYEVREKGRRSQRRIAADSVPRGEREKVRTGARVYQEAAEDPDKRAGRDAQADEGLRVEERWA